MKTEYNNTISDFNIKLRKLIDENLVNKIKGLKENPHIQTIKENPKCFVINKKNLGLDNWTPFYHCFELQYDYLLELVKTTDISNIINVFDKIVLTGRHRKYNYHTVKFNPKVIEVLRKIIK